MPTLKADSGIEWNYYLEGEEHPKTIVFFHGWGVDGRIWRQQTKHFSQAFKIVSVDLPGHGGSSWQKVPLDVMCRDLKKILDHLQIARMSVVASSLGGLFAFKLYAAHPGIFERMVLVGSMPKFSQSENYPYGLDVSWMRKLNGQLDTAYPSIVNIFFRSLFTQEERASRRFKWLQKFRQADDVPMKQALAEYLDILEQEDLRPVMEKFNLPLQVINGEDDEICTVETVSYIKETLPHAKVYYFKECGHFPFLSKPHEFNEVLEGFLKGTE